MCAAGGGRGAELVPGMVGLLPHEHCKATKRMFAKKNSGIPQLNGPSCFSMGAVSYKSKAFVTLNTDIFNDSSAKGMKETVEVNRSNLHYIHNKATYNRSI
nr:hypothetical protein Iba_chr09aCG5430 [Ipomoea batatas]